MNVLNVCKIRTGGQLSLSRPLETRLVLNLVKGRYFRHRKEIKTVDVSRNSFLPLPCS